MRDDTEDGFLRGVLASPKDDDLLLVYSDWLEEQGDVESAAKAEFLRLTVELSQDAPRKKDKRPKRLQELAATLDTGWLGIVSRLPIENCLGKREKAGDYTPDRLFRFVCDRRWEDLRTTEERTTRFCEGCSQNVHYCDTITQARQHAQQGHCVAVDLGVIRRERDLEPEAMWLGRPSVEMLRQEEERMRPDPVSAERERRKRQQGQRRGN